MRKSVRFMVLGAVLLLVSTAGVAAGQESLGHLRLCSVGSCEGTEDGDLIVAGNDADEIIAKGGDDDIELDAVFLNGSNDVAYGGPGRDCIDGGGGDDLMIGGDGNDDRPCEFTFFVNTRAALTGGPGNDRIEGGPGNDTMDGIFDDDTLLGGPGNDLLEDFAQRDRDKLYGGPGNDTLNAKDGDGMDIIDGGPGVDGCTGDPGDTLVNCEIGTTRTAPSGDNTRPDADVTGVRTRSCTRRAFAVTVTAHDTGGIASVDVRDDAQPLATKALTDTTDTSLAVRVPVTGLRPGRHQLALTVQDEAGNLTVVRRAFSRCGARRSSS